MNARGIIAIYNFEMARALRTVGQSIAGPVISTVLYFIVFGAAIGARMHAINGVPYGAFIVPGLMMLTVMSESVSNASFGIYFPRFTGTIYEILSAPLSATEIICGYVGAAASKSFIIGIIVLSTAWFFVPIYIMHPLFMVLFLLMTCISFSLLGFIIGIWADGFEKVHLIPALIITPMTFLGGSFYSITMLPAVWYKVSLLNPVVYLISGLKWSFYGHSDVDITTSVVVMLTFTATCLSFIVWIFKTGYGLKK